MSIISTSNIVESRNSDEINFGGNPSSASSKFYKPWFTFNWFMKKCHFQQIINSRLRLLFNVQQQNEAYCCLWFQCQLSSVLASPQIVEDAVVLSVPSVPCKSAQSPFASSSVQLTFSRRTEEAAQILRDLFALLRNKGIHKHFLSGLRILPYINFVPTFSTRKKTFNLSLIPPAYGLEDLFCLTDGLEKYFVNKNGSQNTSANIFDDNVSAIHAFITQISMQGPPPRPPQCCAGGGILVPLFSPKQWVWGGFEAVRIRVKTYVFIFIRNTVPVSTKKIRIFFCLSPGTGSVPKLRIRPKMSFSGKEGKVLRYFLIWKCLETIFLLSSSKNTSLK
jgi:hypothetical protein